MGFKRLSIKIMLKNTNDKFRNISRKFVLAIFLEIIFFYRGGPVPKVVHAISTPLGKQQGTQKSTQKKLLG